MTSSPSPSSRRHDKKRPLAIVLALALGCGAVLGAVWAYETLPEPTGILADTPPETAYPITLTDFRDQRAASLVPAFVDGTPLSSAAEGLVTASSCRPGQALESGRAAFRVDDAPVIALAAATPFFRDLGPGDSGTDVDSLRGALVALGFDLAPTGAFRSDLSRALDTLGRREGLAGRDGRFVLSDVIWTPTPSPVLSTCPVHVGAKYVRDTPFAMTTTTLVSLTVSSRADDSFLPGERTADVLGTTVIIPPSGVISDPEELERVASQPRAAGQLSGKKDGETPAISATTTLTTPLRAAAVPLGSVFGTSGASGCVVADDGTVRRVSIVGAALGMSMVTFEEDPPATVALNPGTATCVPG